MNGNEWLFARDYSSKDDLWKAVKELEDKGICVTVDDNGEIIYHTSHDKSE